MNTLFEATLAPVALPIWSAPPPKFQVFVSIVTVLFREPLPIHRPVLNTATLVTVMVLLLPPVLPTVIRPLLEKVFALSVPKTFKLLLLAPAPVPTVIAPPPT